MNLQIQLIQYLHLLRNPLTTELTGARDITPILGHPNLGVSYQPDGHRWLQVKRLNHSATRPIVICVSL